MTARRLVALAAMAVVAGVAGALLPMARAGGSGVRPAAISVMSSGDLAVLDSHRGVFVLSARSGEVRPLVRGFGLFEATDMTTAPVGGADQVFVTMSFRSASNNLDDSLLVGSSITRLVRYDASGRRLRAWQLPPSGGRMAGIALVQGRTVYVGNSSPPEIYRLDLERPTSILTWWTRVRAAEALGPIAYDAGHGRLLIADPFLGCVYSQSVAGGKLELLLERLGEVSALAVDPARGHLFIVDTAGRRIFLVDLAEKSPKARIFSRLEQFRQPIGLAVAADGSLWVGDQTAGAVFLLSREGALARTFLLRDGGAKAG